MSNYQMDVEIKHPMQHPYFFSSNQEIPFDLHVILVTWKEEEEK